MRGATLVIIYERRSQRGAPPPGRVARRAVDRGRRIGGRGASAASRPRARDTRRTTPRTRAAAAARVRGSASHTSHDRDTEPRWEMFLVCLAVCSFRFSAQWSSGWALASLWGLYPMLYLRLSRDSSLTRASWVWHSPHTLCQCLCRVCGGGGRARAPFLPPPASAQRPRLPAPRPPAARPRQSRALSPVRASAM